MATPALNNSLTTLTLSSVCVFVCVCLFKTHTHTHTHTHMHTHHEHTGALMFVLLCATSTAEANLLQTLKSHPIRNSTQIHI